MTNTSSRCSRTVAECRSTDLRLRSRIGHRRSGCVCLCQHRDRWRGCCRRFRDWDICVTAGGGKLHRCAVAVYTMCLSCNIVARCRVLRQGASADLRCVVGCLSELECCLAPLESSRLLLQRCCEHLRCSSSFACSAQISCCSCTTLDIHVGKPDRVSTTSAVRQRAYLS